MSIVSEAESIIAKYSAAKSHISRPSNSLAMHRFGLVSDNRTTADTAVGMASEGAGVSAASCLPSLSSFSTPHHVTADASPSSSFRIVQRGVTPSVGSDNIVQSNPKPSAFEEFPSYASPSSFQNNNNANVISPRRSVRTLPIPATTPIEHKAAVATIAQPQAIEQLRATYANQLKFFDEVARDEQEETNRLRRDNGRLREELIQSDMIKDEIELEREAQVHTTQEICTRQVLQMRKTLILSEQVAGSLRTENEALYYRATDNDVLREEVEMLKVKNDDCEKRLTILAQQNSALQRALKQKEIDCQADLDLYVKQLDLVQVQNATMKREMEIMTINAKQQTSLEQEIDRLRNKNSDLQQSIQAVDQEAAAMQERMQRILQEKDDDCAREILNYRRHIMSLEQQNKTLQVQLEAQIRRQKPSVMHEELTQLTKKVETLSEVLVRQEAEKDAVSKHAKQLEDALRKELLVKEDFQRLHAQASHELHNERKLHQQAQNELAHVTASLSRAVSESAIQHAASAAAGPSSA